MSEDHPKLKQTSKSGGKPGQLRKKKKDKRIEQFDHRGKYSSRGQRLKQSNLNLTNQDPVQDPELE